MPNDHDRVQKILQDMQRLIGESKALAKKHAEIMEQYERLKEELESLHNSRTTQS